MLARLRPSNPRGPQPPAQPRAPKPKLKPYKPPANPIVRSRPAAGPAGRGGAQIISRALPATQGMPSLVPVRPQAQTPKAPAKPKVQVTVHPDGRIVVHHNPEPTAPETPGAAATAPAASKPPKPHAKPPARVTAAAAPGHAPMTLEQQAQALLDPVKASILGAINQRTDAEQAAINGYSKDLASMMGQYAPASKAIYGNAQAGQAAVDAALGQTLAGAGQSGQNELAANLQKIDADPATAARLAAQAGATAQGAQGAFAAKGASSLSDLISRGASAQDYGAKLPGVAGLYGLQATKTAQSKATTDTANAVAQLEQQLPGIVNQIRTTNNQQKQLKLENRLAAKEYGLKVQTAKAAASTAATRAQTAAETARVNAAYKQAQLGIQDSKLKLAIAKEQRSAQSKGQHLGLSAKDWQGYNSLALSGARAAHNGTPDGTHPPISWQQYLTVGLGEKIPISVLIAQGKKVYSKAEIEQGLIPGKK